MSNGLHCFPHLLGVTEEFVTKRADIPGSSRALGWDTMLPTSSCGTKMSSAAFGMPGVRAPPSAWVVAVPPPEVAFGPDYASEHNAETKQHKGVMQTLQGQLTKRYPKLGAEFAEPISVEGLVRA